MLLLLHALIPCLAAYTYTALVSLHFGTVIPTSFNILMEMLSYTCFTDISLYTCLQIQCSLHVCEPHPFFCSWSYEMHMSNNEEMHRSASIS